MCVCVFCLFKLIVGMYSASTLPCIYILLVSISYLSFYLNSNIDPNDNFSNKLRKWISGDDKIHRPSYIVDFNEVHTHMHHMHSNMHKDICTIHCTVQ